MDLNYQPNTVRLHWVICYCLVWDLSLCLYILSLHHTSQLLYGNWKLYWFPTWELPPWHSEPILCLATACLNSWTITAPSCLLILWCKWKGMGQMYYYLTVMDILQSLAKFLSFLASHSKFDLPTLSHNIITVTSSACLCVSQICDTCSSWAKWTKTHSYVWIVLSLSK